ncbi:hypothetical protein CYY_010129 [Polysphondylium violaceum]|uniref:FNIP repeat-containing protein n=1 Tax=Polysphondylium violaceum TaxID=133409 RepID=A0A8J4PK02_9MYCE|nr:hypothetical protein CYY_010129 [Polysphondylium violaceum]
MIDLSNVNTSNKNQTFLLLIQIKLNISSNGNIDQLFFNKIWRNKILREEIKNQVFKGNTISFTITSLCKDFKYLFGIDISRVNIKLFCFQHQQQQLLDFKESYQFNHFIKEIEFNYSNNSSNDNDNSNEFLNLEIILNNPFPLNRFTPGNLKQLEFSNSFTMKTKDFDFLPRGLKILRLGRYESILKVGMLPNSLECLHLGEYYQDIQDQVLPNTITNLHFGKYFNNNIISLPSSIKILHFGDSFNQPLDQTILAISNLKELNLGNSFDQRIGSRLFPETLETLILSKYYPKRILAGMLPPVSTLEYNFIRSDQIPQPNSIPNTVTCLTFGEHFNSPIVVNFIPDSVKQLHFKSAFYDKPFKKNVIPKSVESFSCTTCFSNINNLNLDQFSNLELNIQIRDYKGSLPKLSPLVNRLELYDPKIINCFESCIPKTIKSLVLGIQCFNLNLLSSFNLLTTLTISTNFNKINTTKINIKTFIN